VNAGLSTSAAETGLKPEKNPSVEGLTIWIGTQGLAKVD
jgi:hypothetical protein